MARFVPRTQPILPPKLQIPGINCCSAGTVWHSPVLSKNPIRPACGFQNVKAPGFEADYFLAAAAAKEEKRGGTVLIVSGDRDTFQLVSDHALALGVRLAIL